MSPTSAHRTARRRTQAFTLLEVMIAMSLMAVTITATMSGYLFLARNMVRMSYSQELEKASRTAFYLFQQDVAAAAAISSISNSGLTLTTPAGASIVYSYSGTSLTRTAGGVTSTLLTGLTAFDFNWYNVSGTSLSSILGAKEIDFSFTSAAGTSTGAQNTTAQVASGTAVTFTGVSPRAILRNSALLIDPVDP